MDQNYTANNESDDYSSLMRRALAAVCVFGLLTVAAIVVPALSNRETQDVADTNSSHYKKAVAQLTQMPGYQHLPYRAQSSYIDFDKADADGRVLLTIDYTDTKDLAMTDYNEFLAKFKDPGTKYSALRLTKVDVLPND